MADQVLQVPLEYATGKNALLIHARINNKPALLILDTGSSQTVLEPQIAGLKAEGNPHPEAGFRSDGVRHEVELQVGNMIWKKWPVKVMDQSETLSAYLENPDGILGLDFLQEFSNVALDLEAKTVTFSRPQGQGKPHLFGNLRRLNFTVKNSHYFLNDIELEQIAGDSVELAALKDTYRIRVVFQETMLVSKGEPVDARNRDLLKEWSQSIPLVSEILSQKDVLGSLKPLVYTLIAPKGTNNVQLREQLTLLWSADPADQTAVGHTGFGPPMRLTGQLSDVQYRDLKPLPSDHSISKIMLQILYIRDGGRWMTLGAFVIVSKPSGEYDFYLVPRSLLDQIVIRSGEHGEGK